MSEFSSAQKEFLEGLFGKLNSKIDEQTAKIRTEIEEVKKKVTLNFRKFETEIKRLEDQNGKLTQSIVQLERKVRKNNVAIYGIQNCESNITKCVCNIFQNCLGLQITENNLNNVYRIASQGDNNRTPVIVEFTSYKLRQDVLKNVKKLKGLNIYVTADQCLEDRIKNKILVKHLKEARSKGVVAYIKENKLIVANEPFTAEQLENKNSLEKVGDLNTDLEENIGYRVIGRSDSAPSTPNSTTTKRQIEDYMELEEQSKQRKSKAENNKLKNSQNVIKTRSNSVANK